MAPTPPLRVLFLPYQASMWDCMHSIWLAADADPDVQATVVPVPYDELDTDGNVLRHQPGETMPKGVPTEDAESFSLRSYRPDVIFIHNAYDEYNRITRVAQRFRTHALRELGARIIYVPYFIVGKTLPLAQRQLAGYTNVDHIVLQTPEHAAQMPPEIRHKLLPLGSPKSDWVMAAISTPATMLPGQQDRLTVMFTTSIIEFLTNGEASLARVCEILQYAYENPKTHIIWRPHPLLANTLASMRPHLLSAYVEALKLAKRLPNVFLDLSPDYSWALPIAQGYIGLSPSSLSVLFGMAGTPVLILSLDMMVVERVRPARDPYFGPFEDALPFVCAEANGDTSIASFLEYVERGHHSAERQRAEFEAITGPLDGQVGERVYSAAKTLVTSGGRLD